MQTTSPFEMEQQNVDILLLTSVRVRACVRPIRCCAAVQTAKCTTDSALSHSLTEEVQNWQSGRLYVLEGE